MKEKSKCLNQLGVLAPYAFCYKSKGHKKWHKGITFYGQEVWWSQDLIPAVRFGKKLI